ncbi:MAG TPA: MATE family efflux transporter [Woeseiaceae bacterium]|nr:MATE family efflux transporter [Woeseiaceae bacterium]
MSSRSGWRKLASFISESLRENTVDFTRGPVNRALGLLAIPMMLEMAMESVFAVVDIAFVSRLGTDAVAAVGMTEALVTVLYAVAIGLGMGVTAMVSRRIGAKDHDGAARVTGQAMWAGAILSLVTGTIGVLYASDMLRLLGAGQSVVNHGSGYTTVMLGGSASILYLFLLNAAFRGAGDATIALRSLWLANGINIVLDPLFIFGIGPFPELGVTGAAVATTIGRSAGIIYQLSYLYGGRGRLAFAMHHLRLDGALIWRLFLISLGGISQFLIATASWIALMRIVALYGSAAVAAYTISLRMLEFAILPAWGLGNAAATLVGQNLGAGLPDRAARSAWQAAKINAAFMFVVGVLMLFLAREITGVFTNDPEVLRVGTDCLRILGVGYPAYAVGMIMIQALNGAGDTKSPSVLNFLCFWLLQIPLAYWLAEPAGFGPNGVFVSIVVSESLLSLAGVLVFRRGRWKTQIA